MAFPKLNFLKALIILEGGPKLRQEKGIQRGWVHYLKLW